MQTRQNSGSFNNSFETVTNRVFNSNKKSTKMIQEKPLVTMLSQIKYNEKCKKNEKHQLKKKIEQQIKKSNSATTIATRLLSFIELYDIINKNALLIKQEIPVLAGAIIEKSSIIINEIDYYIDNQLYLIDYDIHIMKKTIDVIQKTVIKIV